MKSLEMLMDRWDGQLPSRQYDPHGQETLGSKLRRAVSAQRLQAELEARDPAARSAREKRQAEADAEARAARNREHEDRFWGAMPNALRDMGLRGQELDAFAAIDTDRPAVKAVEAWANGTKAFLTLGGPTGVGKTIAACWALMRAREFYRSESFEGWFWRPGWARFVKASDLARFSYFNAEDREVLEGMAMRKWLILDDLGAELASDGWKATLLELIDARARNQLRTIITTNLAAKVLRERYDARVMRRLADFGAFVNAATGAGLEAA